MSKQRFVSTNIWSDPWFVDELSISERYLFIYLFTNEHTTIAGIYEMSLRTMGNETGYDKEELVRMLQKMRPKVHYISGWVVLRNTIKNQNYHSPKIRTGIELVLERVPHELKDYIAWPEDWGKVPEASKQQQLLVAEADKFDDSADRKARGRAGQKLRENVVINDNTPVPNLTTPFPVKYGMDTVSHSNSKAVGNSKTAVSSSESSLDYKSIDKSSGSESQKTAGTTGSKKDASYANTDAIYDEVIDLVNPKFRAWYCELFYRLGKDKVFRMASEARADARVDKRKLFSSMLRDVEKELPKRGDATKSVGQIFRESRGHGPT
jgi:hypothetical protein